MVSILIAKFSAEIERLKLENEQLKYSRDSVTQFYQQEFANLWQKYKVYSGKEEQNAIKDQNLITEAQETKEELRQMFEELKVWIDTIRNEEVKALQNKLNLIMNKTSVS